MHRLLRHRPETHRRGIVTTSTQRRLLVRCLVIALLIRAAGGVRSRLVGIAHDRTFRLCLPRGGRRARLGHGAGLRGFPRTHCDDPAGTRGHRGPRCRGLGRCGPGRVSLSNGWPGVLGPDDPCRGGAIRCAVAPYLRSEGGANEGGRVAAMRTDAWLGARCAVTGGGSRGNRRRAPFRPRSGSCRVPHGIAIVVQWCDDVMVTHRHR